MKKSAAKIQSKVAESLTEQPSSPQSASSQPTDDIVKKIKKLFPLKTVYWHDQLRQCGVTLKIGDTLRHYLLEDFALHEWLHSAYAAAGHGALSQMKLQEALRDLRNDCLYKGKQQESYVRTARIGDVIYLDLAEGRAVRIDAAGWEVTDQTDVLFISTDDIAIQCVPEKGGNIQDLRDHLSIENDEEFQLLAAFLVQSLAARSPFPLLAIIGEQGSGKTHTCEKIASLIAPSKAPLKTMPPTDDAFKRLALQNKFCILDNVSALSAKQADLLCQLSTGIGFAFKPAGATGEPTPVMTSCPIVLNGINNVITRADLLERTITIRLGKIMSQARKPLSELWRSFDKAKPRILGALCDGLSSVLQNESTTMLLDMPRMADFAIFATAAQPGLGWAKESFIENYNKLAFEAVEDSLHTDPLALVLLEYMNAESEAQFEPSEWVDILKHFAKNLRYAASLPTNPRVLSENIARLAPMLRSRGLETTSCRSNGRRYIRFVNANPAMAEA